VRLVSGLSETIPTIKEEIPAVTRDPKDDYLLAYALVGEADYLVTGDKDLLVLKQVDTVKIVTSREFLSILKTAT
jgi:putative PIN family toxin of toxin-antitoxin system